MEAALLETICAEVEPLLAAAGGRRVVVWGAGEVGAWLMRRLGSAGVAFVDKNPLKHGTRVAGRAVLPPSGLDALVRDEVWVAVLSDAESVREELAARGLAEGRDFRLPFARGKEAQFLAGLPRLLAFLEPGALAGARVLEVGYGGQPFLALLALALGAREVVASDVAPQAGALRAGRARWLAFFERLEARLGLAPDAAGRLARLSVHPESAPCERLPFPDASFDVVTNTGVLEHVDDPERALGEIARVLRPGGRALCAAIGLHDHRANDPGAGFTPWSFLSYPADEWARFERNAYHQNRWRAADFRRACERLGLVLERSWSVRDARLTPREIAGFAAPFSTEYTRDELAELDLWLDARRPAAPRATTRD